MGPLLTLVIAVTLQTATIERAFEYFERGEYAVSAELLDEALRIDPTEYGLNNLHYLRGRIAEAQEDWDRADSEFASISSGSVLDDLALWHRVRAALRDRRTDDALQLLGRLPSDFPATLRMELADGAPEAIALRIYNSVSTREAQWKRASILGDEAAMWRLLARSRGDDVALQAAQRLDGSPGTPAQRLRLARTYYAHRMFDRAADIYSSLIEDASVGAEAHYALGRTYFQLARYDEAIGIYRTVARRFPGTDWEQDAESAMATTYWRKLDFEAAATAYLAVIEKYDDRRLYQSSVRDLIDIYRSLGNTGAALRSIDRALEERPRNTDRAVLIFTRAKIQYGNGQWEDALTSFRQLNGMQMRQTANGTDRTEARFFEAASLEKLGRLEEARRIWTQLAADPFGYYGLLSVERLRDNTIPAVTLGRIVQRTIASAAIDLCGQDSNPDVIGAVKQRRLSRTRGFRTAGSPETDMVGELIFLRQWDEAFYWANRAASRWRDQALADLAYLASDFKRSIFYADRLRPVDDNQFFSLDSDYSDETRVLMAMLYPTAYRDLVCRESQEAGVNPLWLHAIIWQESRYDPEARSGAAARGLMQFIPETATLVATRLGMRDLEFESLYQPEVSIRLGAHHWAELIQELGAPELALAAYNAGVTNVRRWLAKSGSTDIEVFVSDIGFVQTKNYVREVFALYAKYAHLL